MSKAILENDEKHFYKQVYKDYGKTKKDVEEYVDILQRWCEKQPHFPETPSTNGLILSIVACKFSIEKSKQKLDMYYTVRNLIPEIFSKHPLSPEIVFHSKVFYMVPLPKLTCDHQRILYARLNPDFDPEDFNHELFLVQLTHLIEIILQEDKCYNFHTIFDSIGAKAGHATKFSLMVLKKLSLCLEKVYANRVTSIYLVNFPPFFETLLNTIFRPAFPAKLRNRIKVYGSTDILLKDFGKAVMPKDIGGEEMSLEELRVMLYAKYQEWKPRFDKIQYMTVDESLRPSKLKNDDVLGYYGNFKKISID